MTEEPGHTQVLRAMGTGGLIAGLISCFFLGWWGLVLAVVLFVGTAVVDSVIDAVSAALEKQRKS